jgi:hypothetical protein
MTTKMNEDLWLFQAACEALWGRHYRSEAARKLGVSLRTLMRWDAGERPIHASAFTSLSTLVEARRKALLRLEPRINDIAQRNGNALVG